MSIDKTKRHQSRNHHGSSMSVESRLDPSSPHHMSASFQERLSYLHKIQQKRMKSELWVNTVDSARPSHAMFGVDSCRSSYVAGSACTSGCFHDVLWQELNKLGTHLVDVHEQELSSQEQGASRQCDNQTMHGPKPFVLFSREGSVCGPLEGRQVLLSREGSLCGPTDGRQVLSSREGSVLGPLDGIHERQAGTKNFPASHALSEHNVHRKLRRSLSSPSVHRFSEMAPERQLSPSLEEVPPPLPSWTSIAAMPPKAPEARGSEAPSVNGHSLVPQSAHSSISQRHSSVFISLPPQACRYTRHPEHSSQQSRKESHWTTPSSQVRKETRLASSQSGGTSAHGGQNSCDESGLQEAVKLEMSGGETPNGGKSIRHRFGSLPESCDGSNSRPTTFPAFKKLGTADSMIVQFVLSDVWNFNAKKEKAKNGDRYMYEEESDSESDEEEEVHIEKSRFIMSPTSGKRFIWDMLSCLVVLYEAITLPLTFVDSLDNLGCYIMSWTTRLFWTCDLPVALSTGYVLPEGHVELRVRKVVMKYVKTWFCLDLSLVIMDWLEVLAGGLSGGANAARMGKALKFLRMIRMTRVLRLFRLKNAPDIIKIIAFYFHSELFGICLGLVKIMCLVVLLNHSLACCFYAIGNEGSNNEKDWMHIHDLDSKPLIYKYLTAYHWSLTQFAGSMEVHPTNETERLYAIAVLLFAFVLTAFVVSRITSSLTRLEIATAERTEKLFTLRTYLSERKISTKLALRVQRNAKFAMNDRNKKTPEADIDLLHMVSQPLLVELHYEMHMPILNHHPFFRNFCKINPRVMRRVCHQAVMQLTLVHKDILFNEGEVAAFPRMYFITDGRMSYKREGAKSQHVGAGDWACEAALWTVWPHFGALRASSDVSLILLDVQKFQQIVVEAREGNAVNYGRGFVQLLNTRDGRMLMDVEDPEMELGDLAARLCPPPSRARLNWSMISIKNLRLSANNNHSELKVVPELAEQTDSTTSTLFG